MIRLTLKELMALDLERVEDLMYSQNRYFRDRHPVVLPASAVFDARVAADGTGPSDEYPARNFNEFTIQVTGNGTAFSLKMEVTVDGVVWVDLGAAITANGVYGRGGSQIWPAYVRLNLTDAPDSGAVSAALVLVRH